jgi:hypothetical protein
MFAIIFIGGVFGGLSVIPQLLIRVKQALIKVMIILGFVKRRKICFCVLAECLIRDIERLICIIHRTFEIMSRTSNHIKYNTI